MRAVRTSRAVSSMTSAFAPARRALIWNLSSRRLVDVLRALLDGVVAGEAMDAGGERIEAFVQRLLIFGKGFRAIAPPDGGEFIRERLRLLGELLCFPILERNEDVAILDAVAILLGHELDEADEQALEPRDFLGLEEIGQGGLDEVAPLFESGPARIAIEGRRELRGWRNGGGIRRETGDAQQLRRETGEGADLPAIGIDESLGGLAAGRALLEIIKQLPRAHDLPAQVFAHQDLAGGRKTDLRRIGLLEEESAIDGICVLGQGDHRAPGLRFRDLARGLPLDHFQGGDMLEDAARVADLPRAGFPPRPRGSFRPRGVARLRCGVADEVLPGALPELSVGTDAASP